MKFSQILFLCADKINSFFYKLFCRKRAGKNLEKNKNVPFPGDKVLKDGFINRQRPLSAFRFGIKPLSFCGCGVIAVYNVKKSLGQETGLCELICELEQHALVSGIFGLSPHAVKEYFERSGYKVQMICGRKNVKLAETSGKHLIHLYFYRNLSAHYVAGVPQKDGRFCFYNSDVSDSAQLTFAQYHEKLEKERRVICSFLFVIE